MAKIILGVGIFLTKKNKIFYFVPHVNKSAMNLLGD